jgi:quercetin dioxygenase-like cupin family protein
MRKITLLAQGAVFLTALSPCGRVPARATVEPTRDSPRPAVIQAGEGEKRFLRGGVAPLFIKVDAHSTGSQRLMMGASDLPPGDAIGVHRHLREDEIIVITRGTARIQLGREFFSAGAGATVFIPQGTCIGLINVGTDTLSNFFVFSSPGFERALRAISSAPGDAPKTVTPEARAAAFREGHAVANPSDC